VAEQLSRRSFLGGPVAGMLAQAAAGQQIKTAARKPNFILYMPEMLRAGNLGCYGHPLVRTPNMDRLASEGVRFTQCHVQNTVCGPSGCSLLTGWLVHVRGHRSLYYFCTRTSRQRVWRPLLCFAAGGPACPNARLVRAHGRRSAEKRDPRGFPSQKPEQ
jgi:hypothetical protein